MNLIYMLKEQLQTLWSYQTYQDMDSALESWCQMAEQTNMVYMKKFAKSLRRYRVGICNYAKHPLTTARIEAGNVSIGLLRKRARGIRDTEYFKLKIRQLSVIEKTSMVYK
jgi:transposase